MGFSNKKKKRISMLSWGLILKKHPKRAFTRLFFFENVFGVSQTFTPFCKELWQWHFRRPLLFLGVILPAYPKTFQSSCIRNLTGSYVVNIHKNTFLIYGSWKFCAAWQWCYKKFSMIYAYLIMETITLHK